MNAEGSKIDTEDMIDLSWTDVSCAKIESCIVPELDPVSTMTMTRFERSTKSLDKPRSTIVLRILSSR